MHAYIFIEHLLDLNQGAVIATAKQHRAALKSPPKTAIDYNETQASQRLVISADKFRDLVDLI